MKLSKKDNVIFYDFDWVNSLKSWANIYNIEFPFDTNEIQTLESLIILDKPLDELPVCFSKLRLKKLMLANVNFMSIPDEIFDMGSLTYLFIVDNDISVYRTL